MHHWNLSVILEIKLKLCHYTPWRRLGERRCSSHSFSTSALDGGEWSASRPGRALVPEKGPPVPIVQEAEWAPESVWTQGLQEKILSPLPEIEPRSPGRPGSSQTLYWLSYTAHGFGDVTCALRTDGRKYVHYFCVMVLITLQNKVV
jgi:hypothetical protein